MTSHSSHYETSSKIFLYSKTISGISLPAFPCRISLKLHTISQLPRWLERSKASGPDFIPMVVLRNCELELSYILAELFNKCLKESCFSDCWKVWWPLYLRMLGDGVQIRTTTLLVFFLWLVKSLKNL